MSDINSKMPRAMHARPLIVNKQRAKLRKKGLEICIYDENQKCISTHRIKDISHIVLYGNISITTPLIHECSTRDIAISYLSPSGWLMSTCTPSTGQNIHARAAQFQKALQPSFALQYARAFVQAKVYNTWRLVQRKRGASTQTAQQLHQIYTDIPHTTCMEELRGREGQAAAIYFRDLALLFSLKAHTQFQFNHRNRRPPQDPINTMLSFGYACLVREMMQSIRYVGLDPYMGFLHSLKAGRPSLALDLMEEFRPIIVDTLVLKLINKGEIQAKDFFHDDKGCQFTPHGKRTFLRAQEKKMQQKFYHPACSCNITLRQALEVQVRCLMHTLLGMSDTYVGYTS